MNILKKKKRREEVFSNQSFLQYANKSSIKSNNSKAPNSRAEVVINVGLIEANEKGIVSIKRESCLAIKIAKKFSSTELASVAVKNHANHDQFFCGSDEYVLCHPDQRIVQFIPGTNIDFAVDRYKEERGKPYSKIDLYLCNVSNVDSNVNLKVIDGNKVRIYDNPN